MAIPTNTMSIDALRASAARERALKVILKKD